MQSAYKSLVILVLCFTSLCDADMRSTDSSILEDALLDTILATITEAEYEAAMGDREWGRRGSSLAAPVARYCLADNLVLSLAVPTDEKFLFGLWFSIVRKYGYPCEIHRVYTEDKYILEIHRIPHGKDSSSDRPKPVVFIMHGLLSSSAEWILMGPEKGLAYILSEAGYDVWMGNARGNTYSRNHLTTKPTSSSFWKFSWHEIGYYDLPAMIDYVIRETGVPRIHYVGFSQGTTAFWVMASTRPEYNEKIIAMQALAPVGFIANARSPLVKAIAPFTNSLERIFKILGANEFLPNGKVNELAGQRVCLEEAITQALCTNLLFLICGYNADQLNSTTVPLIVGHTPAGASTRQIVHFGQLYNSKKFAQFDYGLISNKIRYGKFKPPAYDLTAIRTPIFLHYADNDWLAGPDDVDKLSKEIKSVVGKYRVPMAKFNHIDFVFAIDVKELIYDRMINIMGSFNK